MHNFKYQVQVLGLGLGPKYLSYIEFSSESGPP